MATRIRPELSNRNRYYIDRHRYYELKHFCLQYPTWKREHDILDGYRTSSPSVTGGGGQTVSPVEAAVEARLYFAERMAMVEQAAQDSSEALSKYILAGVTQGYSYEHLKARLEIPCGKDMYYEVYRRFFWLLDKARK